MEHQVNDIIELDFFEVNASIIVTGERSGKLSPQAILNSDKLLALPGKYHVLKHITDINKDTISGNLFLLHEDYADENTPLYEYDWESSESMDMGFDAQMEPVKIFDFSNSPLFDDKELKEILSDNMVAIEKNVLCFSTLNRDYGLPFNILKKDGDIVGLYFENIGAKRKTLKLGFSEACSQGDFETAKDLLKNKDTQASLIENNSHQCFYWACNYQDKEFIQYLLHSPELNTHCSISSNDGVPFHSLCERNPKMVQELIFEWPLDNVMEIKNFLDTYRFQPAVFQDLKKAVRIRETNDTLNEELADNKVTPKQFKL